MRLERISWFLPGPIEPWELTQEQENILYDLDWMISGPADGRFVPGDTHLLSDLRLQGKSYKWNIEPSNWYEHKLTSWDMIWRECPILSDNDTDADIYLDIDPKQVGSACPCGWQNRGYYLYEYCNACPALESD